MNSTLKEKQMQPWVIAVMELWSQCTHSVNNPRSPINTLHNG